MFWERGLEPLSHPAIHLTMGIEPILRHPDFNQELNLNVSGNYPRHLGTPKTHTYNNKYTTFLLNKKINLKLSTKKRCIFATVMNNKIIKHNHLTKQ